MSVPYIHTFYTPKGYYFYDFNTNAIVRINKSVYDFLNEWEKNKDCPNSQSECGNIIDELKRAGFLSERHWTKIEHPATKMLDRYLHSSVESITLQVTQQCNLKCNYCPYSGSYYNREHSNRHMSFETAKQAIDFYIAHSFDIPVAHIGFYGGEPLIEYDLIRKIVEYCREKCFGKKIMYFMTTNATLLTEEVIDFLMENEFNLSISLDGPRNYHDRNRHRIDDNVPQFNAEQAVKESENTNRYMPEADFDEKAFAMIGPNAPQDVKDAWMEAAKEVNANGLGIKGNGMLSHISQMMVQRLNKQLKGEGDVDNLDILGNTTESAIQATKQALYNLDHPVVYTPKSIEVQQACIKEREFYVAFLEKLEKL